jgi:oligopeptide/dipeptide ABC transporter ATP-binding protein
MSLPTDTQLAPSQGNPVPVVLEVDDVVQTFQVASNHPFRKATVSAVAGVSLTVARGEIVAVVGETGSGKSTLARAILGAEPAKKGRIVLHRRGGGTKKNGQAKEEGGRGIQMVFQDPYAALDPRWSVLRSVGEPLRTAGVSSSSERRRRVAEILNLVGLSAARFGDRSPRELSGGQAQRVAIARALVSNPDLVLLDEPVTALDVSVQAQIINLLYTLKSRLGLTAILIAHDLAVVRTLADRTGIMYLGRLCELAPTDEVFHRPLHPYTAALLTAIPPKIGEPARERIHLKGEQPSPLNPPSGCRFRTRCPIAQDKCAAEVPEWREIEPGHHVACHFPLVDSVAVAVAGR